MFSLLLWLCAIPVFVLDVVLYLCSFTWLHNAINNRPRHATSMQSVEHGEATETHGAPRSSDKKTDEFITGGNVKTIYEMIQKSIQKYGPTTAMVSRKFVELKKLHDSDQFPTKIFDDSSFDEITYDQLNENLHYFGAGLRKLGMEPIPSSSDKSFEELQGPFIMVIFEDTCQQWTTAMQGAFSQSITVATCYATLGEDAVVSSVAETNATVLFLNWKNAEHFAKLAHNKMPMLKTIIASTHEMPKNTSIPKSVEGSKVEIVSSDEVIALGKQYHQDPVPPKPTDVAVIMYTSGSTGKPKGVLMQHANLVAGISGMVTNVKLRPGKEVFVDYLPLAHILALQVENVLLSYGAKLCYSDPRQLGKALPIFKPTIFAGVPAVWDRLMTSLEKKLSAKSAIKAVFDVLLQWKIFVTKHGLLDDTRVSNRIFHLISSKVFGGVLQFGVSGGGPLSAALQEQCRAVFCCPIVQGYALTETCVGGCFQAVDDPRTGIVGPPVPSVEVCLQSEPDLKDSNGMAYLHTDCKSANGEPIHGRGEICFRGPSVSLGYYRLPEKTKEEFDEEGWFHSGDVGQFTSDGVLQIIDRKKNLVKLRGGEYVAIESMETAFSRSPFVNIACVLANGDLDCPYAIVSVEHDQLKKWAKENDVAYENMKDLVKREKIREVVKKSLIASGKDAGLSKLELRVKDCCLVEEEWLPGKGMTASLKLDRKMIYKMHKDELSDMFQRSKANTSLIN